MAGIESNFAAVIRPIFVELQHALSFRNRGRSGRYFGDEVADLVADGIQGRTLDEQKSPTGRPLKANRGRYGKRKRARGVKVGVGLYGETQGGEMLSFDQVRGEVTITPDELTMTAGKSDEVQQKVDWFTTGNPATGQPPRPFYDLDGTIIKAVDDLADDQIEHRLSELD